MFLDIKASISGRGPNMKILNDIASECFMPLGYSGGLKSVEDAKKVFDIGFEKVSINSACARDSKLVGKLAAQYGSQAVVVSIDVKTDVFGSKESGHRVVGKT